MPCEFRKWNFSFPSKFKYYSLVNILALLTRSLNKRKYDLCYIVRFVVLIISQIANEILNVNHFKQKIKTK